MSHWNWNWNPVVDPEIEQYGAVVTNTQTTLGSIFTSGIPTRDEVLGRTQTIIDPIVLPLGGFFQPFGTVSMGIDANSDERQAALDLIEEKAVVDSFIIDIQNHRDRVWLESQLDEAVASGNLQRKLELLEDLAVLGQLEQQLDLEFNTMREAAETLIAQGNLIENASGRIKLSIDEANGFITTLAGVMSSELSQTSLTQAAIRAEKNGLSFTLDANLLAAGTRLRGIAGQKSTIATGLQAFKDAANDKIALQEDNRALALSTYITDYDAIGVDVNELYERILLLEQEKEDRVTLGLADRVALENEKLGVASALAHALESLNINVNDILAQADALGLPLLEALQQFGYNVNDADDLARFAGFEKNAAGEYVSIVGHTSLTIFDILSLDETLGLNLDNLELAALAESLNLLDDEEREIIRIYTARVGGIHEGVNVGGTINSEIEAIENQLAALAEELLQLDDDTSVFDTDLTALAAQRTALELRRQQFIDEQTEFDAALSALNNDLAQLESEQASIADNTTALDNTIASLNAQLAILMQERAAFDGDRTSFDASISEIQTQLEATQRDLNELNAGTSDLDADITALQATKSQLETDRTQLLDGSSSFDNAILEVENELAQLEITKLEFEEGRSGIDAAISKAVRDQELLETERDLLVTGQSRFDTTIRGIEREITILDRERQKIHRDAVVAMSSGDVKAAIIANVAAQGGLRSSSATKGAIASLKLKASRQTGDILTGLVSNALRVEGLEDKKILTEADKTEALLRNEFGLLSNAEQQQLLDQQRAAAVLENENNINLLDQQIALLQQEKADALIKNAADTIDIDNHIALLQQTKQDRIDLNTNIIEDFNEQIALLQQQKALASTENQDEIDAINNQLVTLQNDLEAAEIANQNAIDAINDQIVLTETARTAAEQQNLDDLANINNQINDAEVAKAARRQEIIDSQLALNNHLDDLNDEIAFLGSKYNEDIQNIADRRLLLENEQGQIQNNLENTLQGYLDKIALLGSSVKQLEDQASRDSQQIQNNIDRSNTLEAAFLSAKSIGINERKNDIDNLLEQKRKLTESLIKTVGATAKGAIEETIAKRDNDIALLNLSAAEDQLKLDNFAIERADLHNALLIVEDEANVTKGAIQTEIDRLQSTIDVEQVAADNQLQALTDEQNVLEGQLGGSLVAKLQQMQTTDPITGITTYASINALVSNLPSVQTTITGELQIFGMPPSGGARGTLLQKFADDVEALNNRIRAEKNASQGRVAGINQKESEILSEIQRLKLLHGDIKIEALQIIGEKGDLESELEAALDFMITQFDLNRTIGDIIAEINARRQAALDRRNSRQGRLDSVMGLAQLGVSIAAIYYGGPAGAAAVGGSAAIPAA